MVIKVANESFAPPKSSSGNSIFPTKSDELLKIERSFQWIDSTTFVFKLALGLGLLGLTCSAGALEITPNWVVEKVLRESRQASEIRANSKLSSFPRTQAESLYDWSLALESGYELTRFRNFQGTANPQDETFKTLLTLKKPLSTGTLFSTQLSRTSLQSRVSSSSLFSMPGQQTQDIWTLGVEQSLWKNYFGSADRAQLASARKNEESQRILERDQLQKLLLDGIRLFWSTYVSQELLKESLAARDRYRNLVEIVKRKNQLGFANPGELAQVQAELEQRNQNVKNESANFLKFQDQLITLTQVPEDQKANLQLAPPTELPPPPSLTEVKIHELTEIRSRRLKAEASESGLKAARSKTGPDVALVASYNSSGLGLSTQDAQQELWSGQYPKYYLGIKIQHSFGSGVQTEEVKQKASQWEIDRTLLERRHRELQDELQAAQRKVLAAFEVAQSASQQKDLRLQAADQLQKAYNQGRTDIKFLIDALNTHQNSIVQYKKSVGDYQVALNEWAALRDELLIDGGSK